MTSPVELSGPREGPPADASQVGTVLFARLVRSETGYVRNTLRRLGIRERELDDVTQESFLALFRSLAEFDRRRPLRPWLFGVVFRIAGRHKRDLMRHPPEALLGEPFNEPDETWTPDEHLEREPERQLVIAALDQVDFDRRAVVIMHDVDEMAMPDIVQALGITLNTVYSRLRVGREEFQHAVGRLRNRGARR